MPKKDEGTPEEVPKRNGVGEVNRLLPIHLPPTFFTVSVEGHDSSVVLTRRLDQLRADHVAIGCKPIVVSCRRRSAA